MHGAVTGLTGRYGSTMTEVTRTADGLTTVSLRPVEAADEAFLRDVYGSTREQELALTAWTDEQKATFVAMQFAAQSAYYAEVYPKRDHSVIVVDGEDAGRLFLARLTEELRIVDITLLPKFRGRGVGTTLLSEVLAEAGNTGRRAVIHVEHENPARLLYEQLGFVVAEDLGVYFRMEWSAPATS